MDTYERLTAAATISRKSESKVTELWEKTDAFMSDAVAKNLEIQKTVPEVINSSHEPYHILRKSHTVEKLDRSNLSALNKLEKDAELKEKFESANPALKPYF